VKFKRMTPQQREVYQVLRAMGEIVVQPNDARPLKALKKRGLIRYRRLGGVRYAVLRVQETAEQRRMKRWGLYDFWPK